MSPPSHPRGLRLLRDRPSRSRRLREEILQDRVEVLARAGKEGARVEQTGVGPPARQIPGDSRSSGPTNLPYRPNLRLFFLPIRLNISGFPQREHCGSSVGTEAAAPDLKWERRLEESL